MSTFDSAFSLDSAAKPLVGTSFPDLVSELSEKVKDETVARHVMAMLKSHL